MAIWVLHNTRWLKELATEQLQTEKSLNSEIVTSDELAKVCERQIKEILYGAKKLVCFNVSMKL